MIYFLNLITNKKTKQWYPNFDNIYNALEYAVKVNYAKFEGLVEKI